MTIFPNYVCQKCGFKLASPSEECVACGFKEVRIYTVKDAGEINRLQSELTKYKKACEVLMEVVKDIDSGSLEYYDSVFKDHIWEIDETEKPIDPEYYVYQELKKARQAIQKVEDILK